MKYSFLMCLFLLSSCNSLTHHEDILEREAKIEHCKAIIPAQKGSYCRLQMCINKANFEYVATKPRGLLSEDRRGLDYFNDEAKLRLKVCDDVDNGNASPELAQEGIDNGISMLKVIDLKRIEDNHQTGWGMLEKTSGSLATGLAPFEQAPATNNIQVIQPPQAPHVQPTPFTGFHTSELKSVY